MEILEVSGIKIRELDMLRKRKDNINNKLNRLLDSYLNEIISKENFIDKKKELETESKEVSELIDELEKKTSN